MSSTTNTFQVRFLFFNVDGETWTERTVHVHEFIPMTWKRCTHVEWAERSLDDYSPEDLRDMMDLPQEGSIQVLATGTLTGYSYSCDYGTEWDEDLEFSDVKSEPLSEEFVNSCRLHNPRYQCHGYDPIELGA